MDSDQKRFIVYIIAIAVILSFFATIYWTVSVKPDLDERDKARFIPGGWTPELKNVYNNSDPIEFMEFRPFSGILINNKSVPIDELVIIMIPEGVESRASFITRSYTDTWKDENVLIGNNIKSTETYVIIAYIFADMNVSNALYDRHEEFNHPSMTYNEIKVWGIDLTLFPFYDVEVE